MYEKYVQKDKHTINKCMRASEIEVPVCNTTTKCHQEWRKKKKKNWKNKRIENNGNKTREGEKRQHAVAAATTTTLIKNKNVILFALKIHSGVYALERSGRMLCVCEFVFRSLYESKGSVVWVCECAFVNIEIFLLVHVLFYSFFFKEQAE